MGIIEGALCKVCNERNEGILHIFIMLRITNFVIQLIWLIVTFIFSNSQIQRATHQCAGWWRHTLGIYHLSHHSTNQQDRTAVNTRACCIGGSRSGMTTLRFSLLFPEPWSSRQCSTSIREQQRDIMGGWRPHCWKLPGRGCVSQRNNTPNPHTV